MTAPIDGAVNVMHRAVVRPRALPLRLEPAHWRHGCPHDELARRQLRLAAAADASGDLGLRRRDDGRHDAVVPRRRPRRAAPGAAARRSDRPVVKPITVVVTASGAPGTAAPAACAARERRARSTARRHRHERAVGRAAPVRRLPPRAGRVRPPTSRRRCGRSRSAKGADAILPQSSFDLEGLAGALELFEGVPGARLAAGREPPVERQGRVVRVPCGGSGCRRRFPLGSPARRRSRRPAHELGYPERAVCFKPVFSSGSRGFRILDPTVDRAEPAATRAARVGVDAARGRNRDPRVGRRPALTCS